MAAAAAPPPSAARSVPAWKRVGRRRRASRSSSTRRRARPSYRPSAVHRQRRMRRRRGRRGGGRRRTRGGRVPPPPAAPSRRRPRWGAASLGSRGVVGCHRSCRPSRCLHWRPALADRSAVWGRPPPRRSRRRRPPARSPTGCPRRGAAGRWGHLRPPPAGRRATEVSSRPARDAAVGAMRPLATGQVGYRAPRREGGGTLAHLSTAARAVPPRRGRRCVGEETARGAAGSSPRLVWYFGCWLSRALVHDATRSAAETAGRVSRLAATWASTPCRVGAVYGRSSHSADPVNCADVAATTEDRF